MNTIEDFKNAPVGATATHPLGSRAMKMDDGGQYWIAPSGSRYNDEGMVFWGYTLDPSAPTTAREALDLAWELAHPVKEGQTIPAGTDYLVSRNGERPATMRANCDQVASKSDVKNRRTLDPLPDPVPDWLDAPAVMARLKTWIPEGDPIVFARYAHDHSYWLTIDPPAHHWSELVDVTPLYPKGQDA